MPVLKGFRTLLDAYLILQYLFEKNLLLIFKLYYFDMDFSSDSYSPFHLNSKNAI